jgi:hypothetical protein
MLLFDDNAPPPLPKEEEDEDEDEDEETDDDDDDHHSHAVSASPPPNPDLSGPEALEGGERGGPSPSEVAPGGEGGGLFAFDDCDSLLSKALRSSEGGDEADRDEDEDEDDDDDDGLDLLDFNYHHHHDDDDASLSVEVSTHGYIRTCRSCAVHGYDHAQGGSTPGAATRYLSVLVSSVVVVR